MKSIIKLLNTMVKEGEIESFFLSYSDKTHRHCESNGDDEDLRHAAISALEHMELEEESPS